LLASLGDVVSETHILARTRALAGIDPEALAQLTRCAITRVFGRGDNIWHAGDAPRGLVVVAQGLVKVVRPAPKGRSTICGIFGPGESIGDVAFVRNIPYPADAVAATDTVSVIEAPGDALRRCLERQPELGMSLACGMADKLSVLHGKIDVLSAGTVEARLATLILELYEKLGDDFEDGSSHVPLALSRRELADLVATTLETTIRTMSRWEREGVVATLSDGFRIDDLNQLRRTAGQSDDAA
jgi:CRP/FNR family transcriptional regulator